MSLVCEFGNLECTSPSGLASRTYAANVACLLFAFVPSSVGCANSQIDGANSSNFETIVFQRGPLVWLDGVYVALGLGVADECCRFGKVHFAFVPSIVSSIQMAIPRFTTT